MSNMATTPTNKQNKVRKVFADRSPQNNIVEPSRDVDFMQKTLKNGVGLFQQLANQNKLGSEKK